jgi:aminopeptidase N
MADTDDCLTRVNGLLSHPDFSIKNPNKVGALVGVFAGNLRRFHAADGSGYRWLADRILEVLAVSAARKPQRGSEELMHSMERRREGNL